MHTMAKPKRARPRANANRNPRKEHPYLVGCTNKEATLLARGAKKLGMGPTTFLREIGLFRARQALGLRQPGEA